MLVFSRFPIYFGSTSILRLLHAQPCALFVSFYFQNTVEGRIAYFPVVGRLVCKSSSADHRGYWEHAGFGLLGIYKSDWTKIGGEWNSFFFF